MPKFTAQVLKSVTSNTVGIGALAVAVGPNSGRIRITGLILGPDAATLGTSNRRFEIQRSTTLPTGTSITPRALDGADGTALRSTCLGNLSANGTLTSGEILLTIPLSEQASFRWVAAAPDEAIIIPATVNAGIHLMTPVSGGNQSVATQWYWDD